MSISGGPLSGGPIGAAEQSGAVGRRPYPYLIQAGVKLKIKEVRVEVIGAITGGGAKIKGTQANGFNISETALTPESGVVYKAENLEVTTAFANRTAFYDTFDIAWEVSRDGGGTGGTWEDAGTSKNPIYVCLANPINDPTNFRTVVHLACSVGGATNGATNKDDAVTNTWSLLSGRTFKTWDDKALHYYQKGTTRGENSTEVSPSVAWLLREKTGQCGCWATMLQDALAINGITINPGVDITGASHYITAKCDVPSPDDAYFWVQTWGKLPTSDDFFYCESTAFDMQPPPPDGTYGHYDDGGTGGVRHFENKNTLPGQNSGTVSDPGAPSQKVFSNHQFIRYKKVTGGAVLYYDPSYGATYADEAAFQTKLNGYGDSKLAVPIGNPVKLRLEFKPLPGSLIVKFHGIP